MGIYSLVSPSDTYIVYDQFHFGDADHLEVPVKGHDNAIATYCFYKTVYPTYSLGLCTIEYYNTLKKK